MLSLFLFPLGFDAARTEGLEFPRTATEDAPVSVATATGQSPRFCLPVHNFSDQISSPSNFAYRGAEMSFPLTPHEPYVRTGLYLEAEIVRLIF